MATRINLNEARLMQYHQAQLDEIYLLYFSPDAIGTNIKHYDISAAERAQMSEYDAMGRELSGKLSGGVSAGYKCAVFHRDPDFCNGLPRRR